MADFEKILIDPCSTIIRALAVIDASSLQLAMVVDDERRLLGTLTDGDIRRSLLRGHPLEATVDKVMNPTPVTATRDLPEDEMLMLMIHRSIKELPILDETGRVVGLRLLRELAGHTQQHENLVVLMAGGMGSRLKELTTNTPKPLLPVGQRPIIGTIVSQLARHGFTRIAVAVNYLAAQIEAYLGDGSAFGADISYLRENKRMGTAGALSLLPARPEHPILVMNADILTGVNFNSLLEFHTASRKTMTICVRQFEFKVPYGVMQMRGADLVGIEEKPTQRFTINAGIYVLEPETLDWLTPGTYCDMPELIDRAIRASSGVGCFPLQSYWIDIGRLEDFQRAQADFTELLSEPNL